VCGAREREQMDQLTVLVAGTIDTDSAIRLAGWVMLKRLSVDLVLCAGPFPPAPKPHVGGGLDPPAAAPKAPMLHLDNTQALAAGECSSRSSCSTSAIRRWCACHGHLSAWACV
jgi:hypothetical protein